MWCASGVVGGDFEGGAIVTWSERCRGFRAGLPRTRPDRMVNQERCAALIGVVGVATWGAWERGENQPHEALQRIVEQRMAEIEQEVPE